MRRRRVRDGFVFVALFSLWDGDGVRNALSWWGFGAISLALLGFGIALIVQERARAKRLLIGRNALPVLAFMALCVVSITWSAYRSLTPVGCFIQIATATVGVAILLAAPPRRLVAILAAVLHLHLLLALLFEIAVALSPSGEILPFFTNYGANVPGAYYWSRGLLFQGGRIQGIVGNANLTCFIALLALILAVVLLNAKAIGPRLAVPAIALDLLLMALTRSATVVLTAGLVVVAALILLGLRRFGRLGRAVLVAGGLVAVVAVALGSSRLFEPLLRVLGKGDDLTGRFEIWRLVGELVIARPVLGWGWIGYWAPWVEPFRGLVIRDGVQYLQAHNAYLDVQLQLGVPGLLLLALVIGSVVYRSLLLALVPRPYTLLPMLLLVALLTQALAESRLLIEGNWALLVMLSAAVPLVPLRHARDQRVSPAQGAAPRRVLH